MTTSLRFVLSYDFLNRILSPVKVDIFPMKFNIVVVDVVNDITYSRKSVKYRCGHNTHYMTLFNGKQRHHMIKLRGSSAGDLCLTKSEQQWL